MEGFSYGFGCHLCVSVFFFLGLVFSCFIVFSSFLITLLLLSFEPADIDFCSPMAARPNFGISLLGNNCTLYGHCGVGVLCLQPVFSMYL